MLTNLTNRFKKRNASRDTATPNPSATPRNNNTEGASATQATTSARHRPYTRPRPIYVGRSENGFMSTRGRTPQEIEQLADLFTNLGSDRQGTPPMPALPMPLPQGRGASSLLAVPQQVQLHEDISMLDLTRSAPSIASTQINTPAQALNVDNEAEELHFSDSSVGSDDDDVEDDEVMHADVPALDPYAQPPAAPKLMQQASFDAPLDVRMPNNPNYLVSASPADGADGNPDRLSMQSTASSAQLWDTHEAVTQVALRATRSRDQGATRSQPRFFIAESETPPYRF